MGNVEIPDGEHRAFGPRGPYGTNEGDIWAMDYSPVGEKLAEKGMIGIHEMLRKDGKVQEVIYSVALDNPDMQMQDIIRRAREGVKLWVEAQAARN